MEWPNLEDKQSWLQSLNKQQVKVKSAPGFPPECRRGEAVDDVRLDPGLVLGSLLHQETVPGRNWATLIMCVTLW